MEEPHLDDILAVLSCRSRRKVLSMLLDQPTAIRLNEISETETEQICLVHKHLPKLDTEGYIEWDRTDDWIERGVKWDDIEPVIELLRSHQEELPGEWV